MRGSKKFIARFWNVLFHVSNVYVKNVTEVRNNLRERLKRGDR